MRLHSQGQAHAMTTPILGRLTSVPIAEPDRRGDYIIYAAPSNVKAFGGDLSGYAGVFAPQGPMDPTLFTLPGIFFSQSPISSRWRCGSVAPVRDRQCPLSKIVFPQYHPCHRAV